MIIKHCCPSIEMISLDGNPLVAYLDKDIYRKNVIEVLGNTLKRHDNTDI